jgi:hypothetical protein
MNPVNILTNLNGRYHSENLGVGWRIILDWILGKQGGKGSVVGCCEHSKEPSGFIRGGGIY